MFSREQVCPQKSKAQKGEAGRRQESASARCAMIIDTSGVPAVHATIRLPSRRPYDTEVPALELEAVIPVSAEPNHFPAPPFTSSWQTSLPTTFQIFAYSSFYRQSSAYMNLSPLRSRYDPLYPERNKL